MTSVAIFGGGVAGLTVAHELVERGFEVTIYEARHWGGKLCSSSVAGTGTDGRRDLPIEHGFHFFPTFYRHVPDTMKRIPLPDRKGVVYDRLRHGDLGLDVRQSADPFTFPTHFTPTLRWLRTMIRGARVATKDIDLGELAFFFGRELEFLMACEARRVHELDELSWWDWNESDDKSPAYQQLLVRYTSLNLLAMSPRVSSAPVMAQAMLNVLYAWLLPRQNLDRSLDADTSHVWIDPWLHHLQRCGARLVFPGALRALRLDADGRRIASALVELGDGEQEIVADHYIAALPVESMARLVSTELERAAPSLAGLHRLRVRWMNGVSIFMNRPLPLVRGHVVYEDSAWALTSVSQSQFWSDLPGLGAGDVREVLSVIISDWTTPGTEVVTKPAAACSREELICELIAQLDAALRRSGYGELDPTSIIGAYVDPNIVFPAGDVAAIDGPGDERHVPMVVCADEHAAACTSPGRYARNFSPLFAATAGSRIARPSATTELVNLFLASDYVSTSIGFASTEGANQAGRMAANGVLRASGSRAPAVRIWPPLDVAILAPLRWLDRWRYDRGLPQLALPLPGMGPVRFSAPRRPACTRSS